MTLCGEHLLLLCVEVPLQGINIWFLFEEDYSKYEINFGFQVSPGRAEA